MGNDIVQCGFSHTLTQQRTKTDSVNLQEDVLDSSSVDVCLKDPLKIYLKRVPPKIKTFTDILQEIKKEETDDIEGKLASRVLEKSSKTFKSFQARSFASSNVQDNQTEENLLELVQEEIEKLVHQKTQKGQKYNRQSIDRGLLFKRLNINLASFIRTKGENIKDHYQFKECVGEGGYGKVFRAICKHTKEERAIKVLKRREGAKERDKASFLSEFELLSTLNHPNIVKLYEIYYYKGHYYVVMQFCKGGSLIDLMKKNRHFSEQSVHNIMKQLLSALAYLHSMNIVHRDIKLDNIVILSNEDSMGFYSIKIIDFGTATKVSAYRTKGKVCGTRSYMAPEVFQGSINVKSDVWSSGVFLYILFVGKFPFSANSLLSMENEVNTKVVTVAGSQWSNVSKEAKKLLLGMLQKNPNRRLSAAQALAHPWFTKTNHSETRITYEQCHLSMLERYQRGNNFIAVIENYLCLRQISQQQRDRLGKLFSQIDRNNDGVIQEKELVQICHQHYGIDTQSQVKRILKEIDQNDSGRIDFNEFLLAMYSRQKLFMESSLVEAFKFYDLDNDGYLERGQLVQLLSGCQKEEVEYLLEEIDTDKDEKVSMEEFLVYLNRKSPDPDI